MHFAHKSAIDTYLEDHETAPLDSEATLTCRICGHRARNQSYLARHRMRRDHQFMLHLPLYFAQKWMRL